MDDLGRGIVRPGHQIDGIRVGDQLHVQFGGIPEADILVVGIAPGDRLDEDRIGQARTPAVEILVGGHDLALENAGQVGHQAFHFGDAMRAEPVAQLMALTVTHTFSLQAYRAAAVLPEQARKGIVPTAATSPFSQDGADRVSVAPVTRVSGPVPRSTTG
ncbi:MAG: hypothetical protein UMU75_08890 [Halomonas sp.]|nr:hypothetical protein [Halomonas sp.]